MRLDLQAVAEQAQRLGRTILTHVNHPTWKYFDLSAEMLAEAREARMFEVCNFATSDYLLGEKGIRAPNGCGTSPTPCGSPR